MHNTINNRNIRLISRNEGKIKSYESCSDLRAWSHDVRLRDRYLREWIKCDMSTCFLPIRTLAAFLKNMTYRSRGKTTPRCHPDCKSKALLESICKSCHAMKEVLKENEKFNKYIVEEEFETSSWPCDRCLDALKSIKIFWKIIMEKIFHIHMARNDGFDVPSESSIRLDGAKSVAKLWERDIVHQAIFIKNIAPIMRKSSSILSTSSKLRKTEAACNTSIYSNRSRTKKKTLKFSRGISVRVRNINIGCSTCNINNEIEELKTLRANLKYLQDKENSQKLEIDRLRQENLWLKCELQCSSKSYQWKSGIRPLQMIDPDRDVSTLKSIEDATDLSHVDKDSVKNIDSEIIITMKNCKNESFKHVSLLQVLHKTNDPVTANVKTNEAGNVQEDPINLLTKVHTTFGAIVKREMSLANEKPTRLKRSDIEATFRRVNACKSVPSFSTISTSSKSNFVFSKDMGDRIVRFDVKRM